MSAAEAEGEPLGGSGGHRVTLVLVDPFPADVLAGAELSAHVRAACSEGCDLGGATLRVVSAESILAEGALGPASDGSGFEATLAWRAPAAVGDWSGTVVLSRFASPTSPRGVPHGEVSLDVGCRALPHPTSIAVWSTGSPVRGSEHRVTVGVKCATGCSLAGQLVEILDEAGATVATAKLEDAPRPGTSSLYAADVLLPAPEHAGVYHHSARFVRSSLELPHDRATAAFTFRCLDPPEHTVTVRFAFEGIDPAKDGIEVRVGPYVAFTDEHGVARIGVSGGEHEVRFWRADLEPVTQRIEVKGDVAIDLVAGPRRVVDEDAERVWM